METVRSPLWRSRSMRRTFRCPRTFVQRRLLPVADASQTCAVVADVEGC